MTRECVCNCCGKVLEMKDGILQEDALIVRKEWGYFSRKDLEVHQLVLCEDCYDEWAGKLLIPPAVSEKSEILSPL